MPKKKKTRDVEEILDGNIDQFEKGLAGRAADDLHLLRPGPPQFLGRVLGRPREGEVVALDVAPPQGPRPVQAVRLGIPLAHVRDQAVQ